VKTNALDRWPERADHLQSHLVDLEAFHHDRSWPQAGRRGAMTVPCPGARTKRQGQRETIAAGGAKTPGLALSVL
jgi:hypothetical protein